MAIVLSRAAVEAWKCGGIKWKGWSCRLVSTELMVDSSNGEVLHVVSDMLLPLVQAGRRRTASIACCKMCSHRYHPRRTMCC